MVLGIPDPVEYALNLSVTPRPPRAGEPIDLTFRVIDPRTGKPVSKFQLVHEKLFHMFIVSQDMQFFVHDHPVRVSDEVFEYKTNLPKPGMYRILGDFYPDGGTPQLIARTLTLPGAPPVPANLAPNLSPKHTANMDVELVTEPAQPLAGFKTMLFFRVKPGDGLQQYLGAWGHMLAASDDLIDLIHTQPFIANGGPQIQFNVIFPRARTYRVWVQFQRNGVVNTAVFDVPVKTLD